MRKRISSEMDLTKGHLFSKIFKFAIPLMLTSILQLLYTSIDLWTVSNYGGGSTSMSAVGSNGALINLIITSLISLSLGSGVTMSIAKGENNKEKAEKILHTSYLIAIVGGIIFGLIGFIIAPYALVWMNTPASIIENATTYIKIYFLGVPFLALVNFSSQMLRSLGDSKRPMWFLTFSGLLNVLFDLLFVIVFKMDVAGVAIATVLSWVFACIFFTLWFMKSNTVFANFSFKKLKVSKVAFKDILKIGIPAGLQGIAFCLPNLIIQTSLYTITNYVVNGVAISIDEIVVGVSASSQVEGYISVVFDAFCVANVAFTGQNFGALKKKNIVKSYWYCIIWALIAWVVTTTIANTCYRPLFLIFINDTTEGILRENAIIAGYERLKLLSATYILAGIMNISGSLLKGMKKSLPPAVVTIVGCTGSRILFLLTLFKLPFFHTIGWLYAAFPISWLLVCLVYIPLIPIIKKKQFAIIDEKLALNANTI